MSEPAAVERAELRELDTDFAQTINPDRWLTVQFNPETLKVTFANQIVQAAGAGDKRGPQARQFVGSGTTKLALQLWFDVTAFPPGGAPTDDVRTMTQRVAYFITPKPLPAAKGGSGDASPEYAPPAVRFVWGSFQFDGIVEQMEESLEFFAADGRPLRASVSLALSQQKITFGFNKDRPGGAGRGPAGTSTPGTTPLAQAVAGSTLPAMAEGSGTPWQAVAAANEIEDPLRLAAGTFVDLSGGGMR